MNTNIYVSNKIPISLTCPKHGVFSKRLNSIVTGGGCPKCSKERIAESRRLTIDYVKKQFDDKGYILLAEEYIDNSTKMPFICKKHKEHGIQYMTRNSLQNRQGCYYCGRERISKKLKVDFSLIKKEFVDNKYILLSCKEEYINSHKKNLLYKCPNGHINTTSYNNFKQGFRCPDCARDNNTGENNCNWKGGITKLERALRPELNNWVIEMFKLRKYTCEISGKRGTLNVHHMFPFVDILNITLNELGMNRSQYRGDYTMDEYLKIRDRLLYNNEKLAQPIVMLKSLHQKFHKFCGGNSKPTSFEQLEEFKKLVNEKIIKI